MASPTETLLYPNMPASVMNAGSVGPAARPPMAAELYAAGRVIGFKCFEENMAFMKCKGAKGVGPSECAAEGEVVHKCVYSLFKEINAKAQKPFNDYANCLERADLQIVQCKTMQEKFENAYYAASS